MDEQKPKGPGGRPTKYKPEYCQMLIEHMAKGKSFETFGYSIGVTKSTTYEWVKQFPEFSDAKKKAWDASYDFFEDLYLSHRTQHKDSENLNNTAFIFVMKNRFGWRDRVEHREAEKDEFEIPSNLLPRPKENE